MNNRNAKEEFMDAFWILYEKKRIEKISIRELCEKAGYNRTTFYVYFKDIYDLLEQFIQSRVLAELSTIDVMEVFSEFGLIPRIMGILFEKNNQYIKVILKNHHNYVLQEMMILRIREFINKEMEKEVEYMVRYQMAAILGTLEFWFQQGKEQITEQQLLTLLYEVSTKGVLSSLAEHIRQ